MGGDTGGFSMISPHQCMPSCGPSGLLGLQSLFSDLDDPRRPLDLRRYQELNALQAGLLCRP